MSESAIQVLVIGMGNVWRGDDSVGGMIAEGLARKQLPGVQAVTGPDEGLSLLELWRNAREVYLFDAVSNGLAAGMVYRIDARQESLPTGLFLCSTHAFGLAEAVELGRVMNRLPPQLIVYGIEGQCFERGAPISARVMQAAVDVIEEVAAEISGRSCPNIPVTRKTA